MKTQILLVILQLNKPLSTSYRSCKSSSLSFWSPNYGSNLHKGHFPSERACCDMIHAFCLLLGIWGCLWRAVINPASNSSFHKMLYSQGKKKERKLHHICTSYHFHSHCHLALFLLAPSYTYGEDVSPVAGRHSGAHVAVLQPVTEWYTGTFGTMNPCNCVRGGRRWDNTCSGAEG